MGEPKLRVGACNARSPTLRALDTSSFSILPGSPSLIFTFTRPLWDYRLP